MAEQPVIHIEHEEHERRYYLLRVLLVIALLWGASQLVLKYAATPLLRSGIQSFVQKESKGLYSVDFEKLSINLTTTGLELINFKLIPDTAVYQSRKKDGTIKTALYQIELKNLHFKRLHVLKLLRKQVLEFNELEINKLSFSLLGLPPKAETQNEKYDVIHKDLYPIIAPYLNALKIKKISLNDGRVNMRLHEKSTKTTSRAEKISVELKNFSLDSSSYIRRDKLFYADSLKIVIENYSLFLNDEIHQVYAKQAVLSVADSTIMISEAGLYPVSYNPQKASNKKSLYYINFPKIELSGVNIYNAWFNKSIRIKNVETVQPEIKVIAVKKSPQNDSTEQTQRANFRDIYALLEGKIDNISIGKFNFKKAKFGLYNNRKQKNPSFQITEFSLFLENFLLDDKSATRKNKFLYADNIEMDVKNYSMRIAENSHFLKADSFNLSTKNQSIKAFNLRINPIKNARSKIKMNIRMPEMNVKGADFIAAYNLRRLPVEQLTAINPQINIRKYQKNSRPKKRKNDVLYKIVSEYLDALEIKKLKLTNARVSFEQFFPDNKTAFYKGKISLALRNFVIDENTRAQKNRIFYASGFDIKLSNYSMKSGRDLHVLEFDKLQVSTFNSFVKIEKLAFFPKTSHSIKDMMELYGKNTLINFYVDDISANDIDVKALIFNKTLDVRTIRIRNPKIYLQKYQQSIQGDSLKINMLDKLFPISNPEEIAQQTLSDSLSLQNGSYKTAISKLISKHIKQIDMQKMRIDSGYLHITNYDSAALMKTYSEVYFTSNISDFKFDNDSLVNNEALFSGKSDFKFHDFTFLLPDKFHKFKVQSIYFSTEDSLLSLKNIRLIPGTEAKILRPSKTVFLPELYFTGLDFEKFLMTRKLEADSLVSAGARIILSQPDKKKSKYDKIKQIKLPEKLGGLAIKNVDFKDGRILITSLSKLSENKKLGGNFALKINNLQSDTLQMPIPFTADKSEFFLSDFSYDFRDSIYSVKADSIYFSPQNDFLLAENVVLTHDSINITKKANVLSLNVRKIRMAGINTDAFLKHKIVDIDHVNMTAASFEMTKLKKTNKPFKLADFKTDIRLKSTKNMAQIKFNKLDFTNSELCFTDKTGGKISRKKYDKLSGKIRKFDTDSTANPNSLFPAEDISVKKEDFRAFTKDSSQIINIKEITFSAKSKTARIRGFNLQPAKSRAEIITTTKYDTSLTYIDNSDLDLSGIDVRHLIEDKALYAENVKLRNPDILLYSYRTGKENPKDTNRINPWLKIHELKIQDKKMPLTVRKLDIINGNIKVEILDRTKSLMPGTLLLSQFNGTVENISNETDEIEKNPSITAHLFTSIENEGNAEFSMFLPLNPADTAYSFMGEIDSMDLRTLNPFLENTALVSIEKGTSNHLHFFVEVKGNIAKSEISFNYSDLYINMVDSIIDSTAELRTLYSSAANAALRHNNPKRKLSRLKTGKAKYYRPKYKTDIYIWTHSVLHGIIKSVMKFKLKTPDMRKQVKKINELDDFLKKQEREKTRKIKNQKKKMEKQLKSKKNE